MQLQMVCTYKQKKKDENYKKDINIRYKKCKNLNNYIDMRKQIKKLKHLHSLNDKSVFLNKT